MGLWFVANSRKFLENLKKSRKFGFSNLKTAATGQPLVGNWWNFRWKKFRPKRWLQAKNHANRSNRAEMRGRKVPNRSGRLEVSEMHFPDFFGHFWKIQTKRNFLTPIRPGSAANWRKNARLKKKHEKKWLTLEKLLWSRLQFVHSKNFSKFFFGPKTIFIPIFETFDLGTTTQKWLGRWVVFHPFWPPVPRGVGTGAHGVGVLKYPRGPTKSPPQGHRSGSY